MRRRKDGRPATLRREAGIIEPVTPPDTRERVTLHILHTNDFHGKLTDDGAATLRDAVAALDGAPYLLLDAGDAVKAGNVGVNPFGEPILAVMSDLGYHAMTLGNREFHVWQTALETKINRARFPVLSANMRGKADGDATHPVQGHVTLAVAGLAVTVFGLTVPMVTEAMAAKAVSAFLFDDPIVTARKQVADLRYSADVLIALTHIGIGPDRALATAVPGIDLIIGGHTHVVLEEPEVVDDVPILQAGSHARYYGHAELTLGRGGVRIENYRLHPLQVGKK